MFQQCNVLIYNNEAPRTRTQCTLKFPITNWQRLSGSCFQHCCTIPYCGQPTNIPTLPHRLLSCLSIILYTSQHGGGEGSDLGADSAPGRELIWRSLPTKSTINSSIYLSGSFPFRERWAQFLRGREVVGVQVSFLLPFKFFLGHTLSSCRYFTNKSTYKDLHN